MAVGCCHGIKIDVQQLGEGKQVVLSAGLLPVTINFACCYLTERIFERHCHTNGG